MFKTLNDLKKDPKTKKATNSYTGGEKSGLAVENNDANEIMNKASTSKQKEPETPEEEKKTNCLIKLYQNCFKVQDGPLRDYTSEENKQFMKELNSGHVPKELQGKYKEGLYVGVEDRRDEICELPPPPKYTAFSGKGVTLTDHQTKQQNIQNIRTNANYGQKQQQQPQVMPVNLKARTYLKCNETMPFTTISIQLHNGEQTQVKLNNFAKVQELYNFINIVAPIQDGTFQILSGFPPKPINNLNLTIEQADLLDAKVRQKV